jgi:hypothetical protein
LTPSPKGGHVVDELDGDTTYAALCDTLFQGHHGGSELDPFKFNIPDDESVNVPNEETVNVPDEETMSLPVAFEGTGPNDVLIGRGPTYYNHCGNQRFLHVLKPHYQKLYKSAQKAKKRGIAQQMVDAVFLSGGRFMERNSKTGAWFEVSNDRAREKASQTLRENLTTQDRREKRLKYPKPAKKKSQVEKH